MFRSLMRCRGRVREDRTADIADLLSTSEGIRLVKAFLKAESTAKRQRIVAVVKGIECRSRWDRR